MGRKESWEEEEWGREEAEWRKQSGGRRKKKGVGEATTQATTHMLKTHPCKLLLSVKQRALQRRNVASKARLNLCCCLLLHLLAKRILSSNALLLHLAMALRLCLITLADNVVNLSLALALKVFLHALNLLCALLEQLGLLFKKAAVVLHFGHLPCLVHRVHFFFVSCL